LRLNTWEGILAQLQAIRESASEDGRIALLVELLVNLRLIGQDDCIPDLRLEKDDIEALYARLESETRLTFNAISQPSARLIYYAREVIKKLPVRQDAEDMIEQIRASAEAFEESRRSDDPLKGFAGDLRKEVHRRLSPRIIGNFLEPYLELVINGNPGPVMQAGYVALPGRFSAKDESPAFVALAQELLERLNYLWDYEDGNLAAVKRQLRQQMDLFDRCFLRKEMESFLDMLTPEDLAKPDSALDFVKRLSTFKYLLKEAFDEGRIALYDFLLLDLSIGKLVFLLANDVTNNHFAEVTPHNLRKALGIILEILGISIVKGLSITNPDRYRQELEELRTASVSDFIRTKRCLASICQELQNYLQSEIIDRMSGSLNRTLEFYEVPTSRLSSIKIRFFNNFIRRTLLHVLSEFTEKVVAAVEHELERQNDDRRLYAEQFPLDDRALRDPRSCIGATWREADEAARPLFGGKGNSILDMARLGLRVPPAFVLGFPLFSDSTLSGELDDSLVALIDENLAELERQSGRRLGYPDHPLLVSIRSGAPMSMPGVMATILNAGISPDVRRGIEGRRGSCLTTALYRRFLENCCAALDAISGPEKEPCENGNATPVGERELEERLVGLFGERFLTDPREQILRCIQLVYSSGGSRAVRAYSRTLATDVRIETAVTVQQLAFGNLNEKSLSGVVITRNPITGDDELFGEFKRQAQGEEVVMGSVHTEPISRLDPETADALEEGKRLLIDYYRQDLDLEFTVEDGTLYYLQARAAILGAFASLVADTDFLRRGIISLEHYRQRLDSLEMAFASVSLPRADFLSRQWNPPLTVGVPINGGVVSGTLVLTQERLKEAEARRESVVYFAHTTKPTDFAIMNGAQAIVTIYPGRTSHAAITAMSMNKPCIVGCDDVEIDYEKRTVLFRGAKSMILQEGERVTADGNTGAVYRGVAPISEFFLPLASVISAVNGCVDPEEAARVVQELIRTALADMRRSTHPRRRSLDDVGSLAGQNVLVRVDANVDVQDGRVTDERRILPLVPTLRTLLARGATPVVCSHLGDPGAIMDMRLSREELFRDYSLKPVADILARQFGGAFVFHESSVGASGLLVTRKDIVPGAVNLIENLRFATGEKDNDDSFARSLGLLSDGWFVNDAFNVCHRRHASITGVPRFVSHRLAGPLVVRDLSVLATLLDNPPRPFVAVFAGAELEAQLGVLASLLPRVDQLVIHLPTERVSGSLTPQFGLQALESAFRTFRSDYPNKVIIVRDDPADLVRCLDLAHSVLWSGPAKLAGYSGHAAAAAEGGAIPEAHIQALHRAIRRGSLVVVCSEDEKYLAASHGQRFHLSSGPRAFLEYLERLSLPGITALDPAKRHVGN
jgi:3-phosphoglycerate kinase/phosphohistidine swiveling domain-containing protein